MKNAKKGHFSMKEILIDGLIVLGALALIGVGVVFFWVATLDIPDLSSFEKRVVSQSTKLYDRTGEIVLYDSNQDVRRTIVEFDQISPKIKNATIAIEDATFYDHFGVRPLAILRTAVTNISGGQGMFSGAGGSTITQQVIKNSVLQKEKTVTRKIKEAILAIRLEQMMSKDEILNIYLNESPYGGTIYGVEEASMTFFGKHASDVSLAEAAYIAALPQAPSALSPYTSEWSNPEKRSESRLEKRKNYVLERMKEEGMITQAEYDEALKETVTFHAYASSAIKAPHFVMYVLSQLEEQFGDEYLNKGYKIITTIDLPLQESAERIVQEYALKNEDAYNASNAALVARDPTNGETLVMVGSRNFFDDNPRINAQYNVATAYPPGRQPGSAFKPFVYAHAFEKGYTPDTIVFDVETQFSTTCDKSDFTTTPDGTCYSPKNYDEKFRGPVTVRDALAQSLNVPAVKMFYLAGKNETIKFARDMGITTLKDGNEYGLSLVLGSGEVTLNEMVTAYGVFAAEGMKSKERNIIRIEDNRGNVITSFESDSEQVLDKNIALQITDILSDNVARTPLFGANSPLRFDEYDVAAKTGTTNDKKDVWVLGYTPNLVVGAWAGNNDNKPMTEISGLIITPLWRAFMDDALKARENKKFSQPTHITTGKPILDGNWANAGGDGIHDILHYVDRSNPQGDAPYAPSSDSQYYAWEYGVQNWFNSLLGAGTTTTSTSTTNTETPITQ